MSTDHSQAADISARIRNEESADRPEDGSGQPASIMPSDLVSALRWRAKHQADRTAFVYLADGEYEVRRLSFGELDSQARSVAAWLQDNELWGERVLLLYPPGLDFIIGFLGCLYAGSVAVPAYPLHPRRSDPRLEAIISDCQPGAAFCVEPELDHLQTNLATRKLKVLATDSPDLPGDAPGEAMASPPDFIAHLQYTSGSTGDPKGVMVSHGNLAHQVRYLRDLSHYDESTVHVSWQPFFHDMGLVGSVALPIYCGALAVILPPAAFLRNPICWLRAITKYRGTGAPAPNFAYDLCVTGTTPDNREGLDLSSLSEAWNGAEPIRAETLDRFSEVFEPYGFNPIAHLPSYGMAETTLCTTACPVGRSPVVRTFVKSALERNRAIPCAIRNASAVTLVGSGAVHTDMNVAIVDPETRERLPNGRVGEIWVAGPSVAMGYWQRPQETGDTFLARIARSDDGPYLRTGDLGFLFHNELYVTGRLKDMIIIRGRNIYPQDVERVAEQSHDALQADACAAFAVEVEGREELALAVEVKRSRRRNIDAGEVFESIRTAVSENLGIAAHWIGLVRPKRVPKTSSGKIMRRACREQYLAGELALLEEWRTSAREPERKEAESDPATASRFLERLRSVSASDRHHALVGHLQKEIAQALELRDMPDPNKGFERLGIDSVGAVELVNRLQDQLEGEIQLPTTLLFDQPNIEAVAQYLEGALFGRLVDAGVAEEARVVALGEPIAVVGLACRFPGARNAADFWQLLENGIDAIREVPDDRWDISAYYDEDPGAEGKMYTRHGGFIDDIDGFDAAFFEISPREAISMDPQHRHLLEVSWLALEDAGIAPASLSGEPVGVFVGISTSDYYQVLAEQGSKVSDVFAATGNAHSTAVGRLSFALGLEGPCVAVDTACSSSLVAIHQAAQSLRQGECDSALVGGVNAIIRPEVTTAFCKARLLAPDGRCKTFDAAADGYIRSEGCGMVVLKRLSDAQRDGDRVLALIRGSAINQDGRSSGLTAPNGPSQSRVIAAALKNGGIIPADVQYLECHGTGTVLGDPIEVQAANAVFSQGRSPDDPLLIGSVKTNLGHLEAAAGIAGLIKVILAFEHRKVPPSLHFKTPNPHIPWASLAVKVADRAIDWTPETRPRFAAVSSFGFAGTNAHVVLEEAPPADAGAAPDAAPPRPRLLALSARTESGLVRLASGYSDWLRQNPRESLADVCHTANTGRNHFAHRAVLVGDDVEAMQRQLDALARGKTAAPTARGEAPREGRRRVAFLFPGEGMQYSGMARELYESEPVFRECLDRCAKVYDELGRPGGAPGLIELMLEPDGMERTQQTRHIRPALYALQVSLGALWESWGVVPDAVLGHSAGEYAAACMSGVFSVEDGLKLVIERARLMESLPSGGAMLSVTAPASVIEETLGNDVSACVSAYNGLNTVISGSAERLESLMEEFTEQERYCQMLPATNAAHSMFVEPILDEFEAYARRISGGAPTRILVSGMTGKPVGEGEALDASYWRAQTRRPVRFAQAVEALFETVGCDVVLELGPQAELMWLAQMCWRPAHKVLWASSLAKDRNALEQMLVTAAQLHANGTDLDFRRMEAGKRRHRRLSLPPYPFEHESFWPGPMGGVSRSELQEGLYRICWEEQDDAASPGIVSEGRRWLILSDDQEAGSRLAQELETCGQRVVSVAQSDFGSEPTPDLEAILDRAKGTDPLHHVVVLACASAPEDEGAAGLREAQATGLERALLTAQALVEKRLSSKLWLVTRGVHAVTDAEEVDPTHAPLWGFGRTFAVEHPERFGGLVDLPLHSPAAASAVALAKSLVRDDGECQVALRGDGRWIARLRDHPLPAGAPLRPKPDATYLITGGTGALGLHMARHLAKLGAHRIVLASRSGGDQAARDAIRELEDAGCRVEIVNADVAEPSDAERLLEEIVRLDEGKPLRGIIHAAGILDGAPTVTQTPELMEKVMAPKAYGARNLHDLTVARGTELDFFVLFSSGAAILGFPWHGNYSAANAYLDGLALHRRGRGLPAVSINWGPWAGEGVATRLQALGWEEIGTLLVPPGKATRLFDRLACAPDAHVCVHPMDWPRWAEHARSGQLAPVLAKLMDGLLPMDAPEPVADARAVKKPGAGEGGPLVRRLAALAPADRKSALLQHLRQRVGEVLGLVPEKVDPESGFFDLGMNSIMAVELRTSLQADLGDTLELQAAVVFNHPTVRRISEYLAETLFPAQPGPAEEIDVPPAVVVPESVHQLKADEVPEAIDAVASQVLGRQAWDRADDSATGDAGGRKALAALISLQAEVNRLRSRVTDPVAIVGMSCRYPGCRDPEEFWRMLEEARDEIAEVPADRWNSATFGRVAPTNTNIRFGGFISEVEYFDAAFFGVSPREAKTLDPQQRLLLEVAWEALENANLAPRRLMGARGGVFVGIQLSDYAQRVNAQGLDQLDAYAGTGNALSASAGRIAFTLGWEGPALAIDTACSSSLVSLHEACSSLHSGECDIALAGGVSLILNPMVSLILSRAQMLSPDGRCKTFDASANGFVRGEGCGMVVLKRLADAERDGDRVLALIRGSAENQDGRSSGLTVPNGPAQERVIKDALARAGLEPASVQYLEAHGTGTSLGDPIEVQAADAVFSRDRDADQPLLMGSVKSNIGHTETAAGIAGVIKVVLALEHGKIPRSLHFESPNPHIPWDQLKVKVAADSVPWLPGQTRRIAGVSSFGFAGTNAHVVLEEPPVRQPDLPPGDDVLEPPRDAFLLALSARRSRALTDLSLRYGDWLERHGDVSLADLCHTANTGRDHHEHRAALVFESGEELRKQLAGLAQGLEEPGTVRGRISVRGERRVAFLFTGQGSQAPGMGRELYGSEPVFREKFDHCAALFSELRPDAPGLHDLVFSDEKKELLDQTGYTQPALYALEVSLASLWRAWGVEPDAVLGHSVGEYAAASVAGVFSLEDGFRLITERGRLMQSLPSGGSMAAVSASVTEVQDAIRDFPEVCIAAFNGLDTVVSGPEQAIDAIVHRLEEEGKRCRRLVTSHAFHSSLMEPIVDDFRKYAAGFSYRPPARRLVSNVSGDVVPDDRILDAEYWSSHILEPVQFERGVHALEALGCDLMLELGPHPVLAGMGQGCWNDEKPATWAGSLRRGRADTKQVLSAAAELYAGGVDLDFGAMDAPHASHLRKVALPFYPFQRQRFWVDAEVEAGLAAPSVDRYMYEVYWRQSAPDTRDESRFKDRTWLVLGSAEGAGSMLAERLKAMGSRVVTGEFPAHGDRVPEDLAACLSDAGADPLKPLTGIVHAWSLGDHDPDDFKGLQAAQERGVLSAHALVRRMLRDNVSAELWLLTQGVQWVLDSEVPNPAHAPMWGFGRSVALAHPEIWGGMLDLPVDAGSEAMAEDVLSVLGATDREDHIAYREGQRWVARLQPAPERRFDGSLSLDATGTYLVTGGLGAVGIRIAERLVERGVRHLALAGRKPPGETASKAIAGLQEIGCTVETFQADVSRPEDVSRLFDETERRGLPPLVGLIHGAGTTRLASIDRLTRDQFLEVMAPKVWGAWLLNNEIIRRGLALEVFFCCSSMASVLGSPHQADYAAANAYLDGLMSRRRAEGLAGCSASFGPWAEAGMSAARDVAELHERLGFRLFSPATALDAMEAAIGSGADQIALVDLDWAVFKSFAEARAPRSLLEEVGTGPDDEAGLDDEQPVLDLERIREAPESERIELVRSLVRNEAAHVLNLEPDEIEDDISLLELGLDSLMTVELINRMRRRLGNISFSPRFVYEHPVVSELVMAIARTIAPDGAEDRTGAHSQAPVEEKSIADVMATTRLKGGALYTFRRYRDGDKAGTIASAALAFGEDFSQVLDTTFEWKYVNSPLLPDGAPVLDILECEGDVVGMHGGLATRFKIGTDVLPGTWGVDAHVSPDHRAATGWFLHQSEEHWPGLRLGMPNEEMYEFLAATESIIDLDRFTELKAGLDLGGVMKARGANPLLASLSGLAYSPVPKIFDLYSRLRADSGVTISLVPEFDERIDGLYESVSAGFHGMMVRDRAFLSWRFDDCPNREYRRFVAERNGKIAGYLVTRDRLNLGVSRGLVVDFLVGRDDWAVFDSLFRTSIADFASRGVVSVTCPIASTQRQYIARLRRHGFLQSRPGAFLTVNRGPWESQVKSVDNWFFTYADGDIDVCNVEESP